MPDEGTVYWITGFAGAGKTTVAVALLDEIKKSKKNSLLLDGDKLREVFGDHHGYSPKERLYLAQCYARLCLMLMEQGADVICATISMFDEVRLWNRQNIPRYIEVYLKVPVDVLQKRDQKSLYSNAVKNVAGMDIQVEEPRFPDMVIINDGSEAPGVIASRIWKYKLEKDKK